LIGPAQAQDSRGSRARPFAIVAGQRTGSTLLVRSLDSSPLIYCAGEIFHDGPNVYHAEWRLPKLSPGVAAFDRLLGGRIQESRIRRHLSSYFGSGAGVVCAVGFKVMTAQLRERPFLLPLLHNLGVTTIFLYRRDTFATALSYAKAKHSKMFHSDRSRLTADPTLIRVPHEEFAKLLGRCLRAKREVLDLQRECGGPLLAYEDMLTDWDGVIATIGAMLGLPALRVNQALDKLARAGERIVVENEDELRERFLVDAAT
jgi:LPS sulfotransferase NodH